jgi:hypothetical protein
MTLLKTKEELEQARSRLFNNRRASVRDVISKAPAETHTHTRTHTGGAGVVGGGEGMVLSEDEEATLEELEERIEACKVCIYI